MSNHETINCVDPTKGARLLSFGLGHLSEHDRSEFEEHLLICPACQAELKAAERALKVMADGQDRLVEKLRAHEESPREHLAQKRSFLWSSLAAAACVIGILFWASDHEPSSPSVTVKPESVDKGQVSTMTEDTTALSSTDSIAGEIEQQRKEISSLATKVPLAFVSINPRGTSDPGRTEFEQAMRHYSNKDYKASASELAKLSQRDGTNTELLLYWGISCYLNGNLREAIAIFDRVEALKPRTTRLAQVRWYRANAKLQEGDLKGSKRDLELVKTSGADLARDANLLLTKIP